MSWTALFQKEFREQVRPAGKWSGMFLAAIAMSVIFGLVGCIGVGVLIYQLRLDTEVALPFIDPVIALMAGLAGTSFGATLLPMNTGIDSIAGERERHTLETLLAGPLGDKEIVWAKASSVSVVSALIGLAGGATIMIALSIMYLTKGFLWGLLGILLAGLLPIVPAFATACTAILFSMGAKTVKDAGQRLSIVILPFAMAPGLVIFAINAPGALWIIIAVLSVMVGVGGVVLPVLAFVRFQRRRLILAGA